MRSILYSVVVLFVMAFTTLGCGGSHGGGGSGGTAPVSGLTINTSSLPAGEAGKSYSATLTASNGTPPYTWSASGLPSGFALAPDGTLSGTPNQPGVNVQVAFTVRDLNSGITSKSIAVATAKVISFSPSTLPVITRGQPYDQTVTVSGGDAPYSFRAQGFPTSMGGSGSGTTFRITGTTQAAAGAYQLTISVTDTQGPAGQVSGSKTYTLTVR